MSPDQKKTFTANTGTTGPAKRLDQMPAASLEPPDPAELDARQARIGEVRRKAPEIPAGEAAALDLAVEDVPPTECDEPEEEGV